MGAKGKNVTAANFCGSKSDKKILLPLPLWSIISSEKLECGAFFCKIYDEKIFFDETSFAKNLSRVCDLLVYGQGPALHPYQFKNSTL